MGFAWDGKTRQTNMPVSLFPFRKEVLAVGWDWEPVW